MTSHSLPPISPLTGQPLLSVNQSPASPPDLREQFREACRAWIARSPSPDTQANYTRDLEQFLHFVGIPADHTERLTAILPRHVAAWRDHLKERGLTNSSVRRKMTVLRSLFA